MSYLECPACNLRIATLGAPLNCPRCLLRNQSQVELLPQRRSRPRALGPFPHPPLTMGSFRLIEQHRERECWEIQVIGEVDLAVAEELRETLDHAGAEWPEVVLGLEGCEFIDASGLGAIVASCKKMTAKGRRLAIQGASGQVLRILSLTRLIDDGPAVARADKSSMAIS